VKFDPDRKKPSTLQSDDFQAEFEKLVQYDHEWRESFFPTNLLRSKPETREASVHVDIAVAAFVAGSCSNNALL